MNGASLDKTKQNKITKQYKAYHHQQFSMQRPMGLGRTRPGSETGHFAYGVSRKWKIFLTFIMETQYTLANWLRADPAYLQNTVSL